MTTRFWRVVGIAPLCELNSYFDVGAGQRPCLDLMKRPAICPFEFCELAAEAPGSVSPKRFTDRRCIHE